VAFGSARVALALLEHAVLRFAPGAVAGAVGHEVGGAPSTLVHEVSVVEALADRSAQIGQGPGEGIAPSSEPVHGFPARARIVLDHVLEEDLAHDIKPIGALLGDA
jgi:hypothetical protein